MQRRIVVLLVAVLVVSGLPLYAGGDKEPVEEERATATGEPQYGGTLNYFVSTQANEPPSPAIADGIFAAVLWLDWIQEKPVAGDTEKYGPRGTGKYAFQVDAFQPTPYLRGRLLESFETTYEKLVWHVRPGIYWAPTEDQKAWMPARELTAEDMAADINRFRDSPMGARFKGLMGDVYATDKYTVVIEFEQFSHEVFYYIGYEDRSIVSPPEVEEAGAAKWENQVGTGAFMFEEYLPGSHMSVVRNPNYWGTTTIDGKEYQMPFIDRVVLPIIPDAATQIAALRTGEIDIFPRVNSVYYNTLDTETPELLKSTPLGASNAILFRTDEPPFDDMNVRRAMMIGTDRKAVQRLFKVDQYPEHWHPIPAADSPRSLSFEEMPEDVQILYKYDPELAKKMLADAGYPNGFETKLLVSSSPANLDWAALVKDLWGKIGVEVEIDAVDPTTFASRTYASPPQYSGALLRDKILAIPSLMLMFYRTGGYANFFAWDDPEVNAALDLMKQELDPDELTRLIHEAAVLIDTRAPSIPCSRFVMGIYYWPWVKNYYGELSIEDWAFKDLVQFMWIDEGLKREMGY